VVRVSVDRSVDIDVDLEENVASAVVVEEIAVDELESDVSTAQSTAGTALAVVNEETENEEEMSKTRVAYLAARDELVKRAVIDESAADGQGVVVADVKKMGAPEQTLYYEQVKNAFNQLVEDWDCFELGKNEGGDRRLEVRKDALDRELVKLVEERLGRNDLAKRFFSDTSNGGGT